MSSGPNEPAAAPGASQTGPASAPSPEPAALSQDPILVEPSESEVDEWAARERRRREAWLNGPTQEERAAWARLERTRRRDVLDQQEAAEAARLKGRYRREAQLAAEGAVSLFWQWSRRGLDYLVRAGRD